MDLTEEIASNRRVLRPWSVRPALGRTIQRTNKREARYRRGRLGPRSLDSTRETRQSPKARGPE